MAIQRLAKLRDRAFPRFAGLGSTEALWRRSSHPLGPLLRLMCRVFLLGCILSEHQVERAWPSPLTRGLHIAAPVTVSLASRVSTAGRNVGARCKNVASYCNGYADCPPRAESSVRGHRAETPPGALRAKLDGAEQLLMLSSVCDVTCYWCDVRCLVNNVRVRCRTCQGKPGSRNRGCGRRLHGGRRHVQ